MKYTLITGASQGMGLHMAEECASLNRNVLLVSLPGENLQKLSKDIKEKYSVQSAYFEIDLTEKNSAKNIYNWVQKNNYSIDFLINNAGFGGVGSFEDYSIEYIEKMIDLNIKATTNLTHYFIPDLKNNSPSFILNNASMIANFPCPYKSIYAASKVYVKYFTEALKVELEVYDISVSLLQPGATPTNEVVKNQINKGGFFARLSVTEANKVAKKAVRDTLNGKSIIIPGWKNRMSLRFLKIVPKSALRFLILRSAKSILNN
ncbi:MAG: short-chain dehydrogenase [Crocinitomicaceae bacterium]|nr:short-chain dehydrogenase [Crocinitomicaceae bacterium]